MFETDRGRRNMKLHVCGELEETEPMLEGFVQNCVYPVCSVGDNWPALYTTDRQLSAPRTQTVHVCAVLYCMCSKVNISNSGRHCVYVPSISKDLSDQSVGKRMWSRAFY